jgi:integrase
VYELVELVPDRWRAFVLLTAFASLRWGEVTALTREDLDLQKRTVRVCRQFITVPGGIQVGPPKSRAGLRIVSFPASIVPELQHHLDTFSGPGKYGLVFPNEHGRPFWGGNFNKAASWAAIRKQLGLRTLHLHDLRHTGSRMGHDSTAARPGSRTRYLSHGRPGPHHVPAWIHAANR